MFNKNLYIWCGLALLIAGLFVSLTAYLLFHITWLTALGICMLILAFILIALGKAIPKLPPEVCDLFLETGINNINAIIEELGIKNKAIYLPSSLANGRPSAFIPLRSNGSYPKIDRALPRRLITRYGANPEDIGLLVSTVGSAATGMLEAKPDANSGEIEAALTYLFTGTLGIADGVNVNYQDNRIKVEINRPRLVEDSPSLAQHCLGSTLASVAASVTAEAWDRPTTIKQEEKLRDKHCIELEIIE